MIMNRTMDLSRRRCLAAAGALLTVGLAPRAALAQTSKSPLYGYGGGGTPFDDSSFRGPITRITVRSAAKVDSIQVTYDGKPAGQHGGGGGNPHDVSFAPGEQIIAVFGRYATNVDQIGFVTQFPNGELRQHGPWGGDGGNPFYIIGKVSSFFGRSAQILDAVGVFVTPPTLAFSPPQ
jgi:hypothetical protein